MEEEWGGSEMYVGNNGVRMTEVRERERERLWLAAWMRVKRARIKIKYGFV